MDLDVLALLPGTRLGHFKIIRLIGTGGMGAVYEAEHVDLRKRVAIKTLKPEFAKNEEVKERFLREGIAASRIRHPHAVDVFDVGRHNNVAYLVMEYLEGESLADLIARERRLSVGRILEVMIPVLAAVNAAHNEDIVHRDLKPENIFLATTRDGVVVPKVVDFGISKLHIQGRAARLTATDNVFGTPEYMSPEQIVDPRAVDSRADQWALGVMLFECVTGVLPFEGESMYALMKEIVEGRPRTLRSMSVLVPIEYAGVVDRALRHDPNERFSSVADMARELLPLAPRRTRSAWMPVFEPRAGQHPSEMPTPLVPPPILMASIESIPVRTASPVPPTRTSEPSPVKYGARMKRSFAVSVVLAAVAGVVVAQWRTPSRRGPDAPAQITPFRSNTVMQPESRPLPPAPDPRPAEIVAPAVHSPPEAPARRVRRRGRSVSEHPALPALPAAGLMPQRS